MKMFLDLHIVILMNYGVRWLASSEREMFGSDMESSRLLYPKHELNSFYHYATKVCNRKKHPIVFFTISYVTCERILGGRLRKCL